jgi:hypothetical protein
MRCILGIPLGPTCIHTDGTGISHARKKKVWLHHRNAIPLALAGYGTELQFWQDDIVTLVGKGLEDIEHVWTMLTSDFLAVTFHPVISREEALRHYWQQTQDMLCPYNLLLCNVAEALEEQSILKPAIIRAWFRRYEKESRIDNTLA